jgi:hypothetical protein
MKLFGIGMTVFLLLSCGKEELGNGRIIPTVFVKCKQATECPLNRTVYVFWSRKNCDLNMVAFKDYYSYGTATASASQCSVNSKSETICLVPVTEWKDPALDSKMNSLTERTYNLCAMVDYNGNGVLEATTDYQGAVDGIQLKTDGSSRQVDTLTAIASASSS